MKKLMTLILVLALALSMSVTAFAEDGPTTISPGTDGQPNPPTASATVSYNVAPTYTVTIPTKVNLVREETNGTVTYEQKAEIKAENVRLNQGDVIQVTLAGNEGAFKMSSGQTEWKYAVTVDDSTTPINSGAVVATFKTNKNATQSAALHFAADDPAYAGNYSGTVTFTLSVTEASAQEGRS